MSNQGGPNGDIAIPLRDGRCLLVSEQQSESGDTVTTRIDITHIKQQEKPLRAERRASEVEQFLRDGIDSMSEAFALFDGADHLVLCNENYRAMHMELAPMIVPGVTFEQIIRVCAEAGLVTEAVGRIDEWVAERIACHRNPDEPFEHPLKNGR